MGGRSPQRSRSLDTADRREEARERELIPGSADREDRRSDLDVDRLRTVPGRRRSCRPNCSRKPTTSPPPASGCSALPISKSNYIALFAARPPMPLCPWADSDCDAFRLLSVMLAGRRPQGLAGHGRKSSGANRAFPEYIGDMPHTWIGAVEFATAIRRMLLRENGGVLELFRVRPGRMVAGRRHCAASICQRPVRLRQSESRTR